MLRAALSKTYQQQSGHPIAGAVNAQRTNSSRYRASIQCRQLVHGMRMDACRAGVSVKSVIVNNVSPHD